MISHNKYIISVKDLTVAYQESPVIWDLDFYVPKQKILGIVGPNGSGKTTLLKSILGIIKPTTGLVKVAGQTYNRFQHNIAYVPQKTSVDWNFPTDVLDVVLMGRYAHLSWFARPSEKDKDIALQALKTMKMEHFAHRHISQLSGGQQQRVFLARALAQQAEILIMDEPFVGIDITTEQLILKLLQQLRSEGKTIIVVHHDLSTVKKYFDWTFLMNKKHIALGETKDVLTEDNIAQTFGSSAIFHDQDVYDAI